MATICAQTVTFALPENDTRQQNISLGQAQDLSFKYLKYASSSRILSIPLHGLTTTVKDALATALESQKAGTVSLVDGGLSYAVGHILTTAQGVSVIVTSIVDVAGEINGISLINKGSSVTTGTKATTATPPGGSGCTISIATLTDQLTIVPDSHIDLGNGAGVFIVAQWLDTSFDFTKNNHDSWNGTLTFFKVA
jgi:hypothetical protein